MLCIQIRQKFPDEDNHYTGYEEEEEDVSSDYGDNDDDDTNVEMDEN